MTEVDQIVARIMKAPTVEALTPDDILYAVAEAIKDERKRYDAKLAALREELLQEVRK